MTKLIDAHSHYMPREVAENTAFFKVGWTDVDRQLHLMDEHSIERAVLLYPTSDAHLNMGGWHKLAEIYNRSIRELVSKHKDRFYGAAIIPYGDESARDEVLSCFLDSGFAAFSLASSYDGVYLDDEFFEPVFDFAQTHKIPVHIHSQIIKPIGSERIEDPLLSPVLEYVFDVSICLGKMMMQGVFLKYPGINFIFAHYGGVLPIVKERFDSTYAMLRKREIVKDLNKSPSEYFKNLYFDTSGSKSVASLLSALEVTDSSHILFGTDYPANQNFKASIEVIHKAGLSDLQIEEITSKNGLSMLS